MSEGWLRNNEQRFEADILAGFCACSLVFSEQFSRYERSGNISYAILSELIGDMMTRGPLWRLKDLCHHLMHNRPGLSPAALTLDCVIGYMFHEAVKLVEQAHQSRYYEPRIQALKDEGHIPPEIIDPLVGISRDVHTGFDVIIGRIGRLLSIARALFCRFYSGKGDNRRIARYLWEQEALVREAFRDQYPELLSALYGSVPERLYLEAAASLMEGGYAEKAWLAMERAREINPGAFPVLPLPQGTRGQGGP